MAIIMVPIALALRNSKLAKVPNYTHAHKLFISADTDMGLKAVYFKDILN